jgi:hypothetical protein
MRSIKGNFRWSRLARLAALAFFGLAVLFQLNLVVRNYIVEWSLATYRTFGLSSTHRSARFLMGDSGAGYISFLRSTVPEEMPIVKPEDVGIFGQQSVLQFFLMPRGIPACPCEFNLGDYSGECGICLTRKSHYVPSVGGFQPGSVMVGEKKLIEFPGESDLIHGIYVPLDAEPGEPLELETISTGHILRSAGLSLLAYVLVGVSGYALANVFLESRLWSIAAAFPVGSGVVTTLVFVSSWLLSMPVTMTSYIVANGLIIGASYVAYRIKRRVTASGGRRPEFGIKWQHLASVHGLILAAVVLVLLVSAALSIGRAYSTLDGIANWAVKGYAIALEESIFAGARWGGHHLEYPQNIHLQIGFFRLMDNDSLPGSKLLFTAFFGSVIAGCLAYWRSAGISKELGALGALLLATTPILFVQSTLGFANLPMSAYLVIGMLLALTGIRQSSLAKQLVGGLVIGLAAWTRLEAAVYSFVFLAAIVIIAKALKLGKIRVTSLFTPMVLVQLPWLLFYFIHGRGTGVAFSTAEILLEGATLGGESGIGVLNLVTEQLRLQFLDSPRWGAIVPVSIAGLMLGAFHAVRARDSAYAVKASLFGLVLLTVVTLFFLIGVSGAYDLVHWLGDSFDRHLIPVYCLLLALSVYGVGTAIGIDRPSLE